ncbi:MAG: hypothetical protein JXQ72_02810, partial [Anaerolineae bacterium]|nr:hypothetical protein [Anaerolineae bacterium]
MGVCIWIAFAAPAPTASKGAAQPVRDTLLITPTTQGIFPLPETGLWLDIAYATVRVPVRLTVTGPNPFTLAAVDANGAPLTTFDMPLIVILPDGSTRMAGWPGPLDPLPVSPGDGRWLVVYDANGVYAIPAWAALPDAVLYLGPLEHFHPDLVAPVPADDYTLSPPVERTILYTDPRTGPGIDTAIRLTSAARVDRYRARFLPDDLGNPGGWLLLGTTHSAGLVNIVRALRATIPADPNLPDPGAIPAPLDLVLPFDCAADWAITWGYHHSTPQNRFAVDFAPTLPGDDPSFVYAAHTGTLALKRYGSPDHRIDTGLTARVLAADGFTSTVYGHLAPGTLALWNLDSGDLPDFEWITVG